MTFGPPPLLLVEDEPLVADSILRTLRDVWPVEHATTVAAALDRLGSGSKWLGAIVDLGLPDGDGLEVIRHARRERPLLPVLVLTARDDAAHVNEAHRLGASYSCKPCDPADVLRFVDQARSFEEIPPDAVQRALSELAAECGLTPRETEVAASALAAASRPELLGELDVSPNTLKGQIRSLLRKTGHDSIQTLSRALLWELLGER